MEREELRPLSDILNDAFDSEKNFKSKSEELCCID